MNNKLVVGLLVLLVGVGAGWYFLKGNTPSADLMNKEPNPIVSSTPVLEPTAAMGSENTTTGSIDGASMEKGGAVTVSYSAEGFVPKSITVKQGSSVTWTNKGSAGMWVASALHPTHQLLPGFDQLKSVAGGGTYTYTFSKVGTWKYHNHVQAGDTGTVVVTE